MYSAAQDTYIVVYDLVADQAMYKLMGHRDVVTQLDVVLMASAQQRNHMQRLLLSSSKDGMLKFWDLSQQCCILS